MKKVISMILLLTMMLSICACGSSGSEENSATKNTATQDNNNGTQATEDNTSNNSTNEGQTSETVIDAGAMTLTKVGTVPDGVNFTSGGLLTKFEGGKELILNQNGISFNDKRYDAVVYLIRDGICVVANAGENETLFGVVDTVAEKELVPCEAVSFSPLSDRFVMLAYKTGAGTADDYEFANGTVDGDSYYYKGYGKILDLEKGHFIPNVEITTRREFNDLSAFGNVVLVEKDSYIADVYAADGTFVGTYENLYAFPESGIALQYTQTGVCVYDKDMNLVSTLATRDYYETYHAVEGTAELLTHDNIIDGKSRKCVTDLAGNVLTAEYEWIRGVYCNAFVHVQEGDVQRLVDFDGNIICSDFASLRYAEPGYFIVGDQNNDHYIYDLTGKRLNDAALSESYSGIWTLKDDSQKLFIFETGETLTMEGRPEKLAGSLVLIESTVYDMISGKAVLNDVDACVATGNSLYVWDNDMGCYTRYIAEYKSNG